MPTIETVIERATAIGIPIAEYEFKATKQHPAPDPPFIIYLKPERQSGADMKNFIRTINGSIELYTDRKRDPDLETRIEAEVLPDVAFQKYSTEIPGENMFQTAYDFTIVQKIERKV